MSGQVLNRSTIALSKRHYDLVIVGGGFMGLSVAFYLRQLLPEAALILVEEEGIPSEQGASHVSPGILDKGRINPEKAAPYAWGYEVLKHLAEETGIQRPDKVFCASGILHFLVQENGSLGSLNPEEKKAIAQMFSSSPAYWDAQGAYASAEAASLFFGYGAVKSGLDLMLNTRVEPSGDNKLKLQRLEYNRMMQRVVIKEEQISTDTVVIALGTKTAVFVEAGWGELLPFRQVYMQYPRIEADKRLPLTDSRVNLPILQARGFYFRPQGEGLLVIPPRLAPDPRGYEPSGGNLLGVRVGVRREILELFLEAMAELPILGWESLNLGKTAANVRGAWEVVTAKGEPEWRQFDQKAYALVGGDSLALGLATAYDLAAHLSKLNTRPWTS